MSKIDHTRKINVSAEQANEKKGILKKKSSTQVFTFRLNEKDAARLENIQNIINDGRIHLLDRTAVIRALILFSETHSDLWKSLCSREV
jgi:hypothetical protein